MIKIGINGFGRIGRSILRESTNRKNIKVVAINDIINSEYMSYLLKYDSVHGILNKNINVFNNVIKIDNDNIFCISEKNIEKINWKKYDVNVIIESTGLFLTKEDNNKHLLSNNVKLVVISGPPKDDIPMYVMGVNNNKYNGEKIISNASCTTNCLAPLCKIINDNFTIIEGLMSTIHAVTSTQKTVDSVSNKDWRGGRSSFQNIIPSSTGAAKAVGIVIPELKNKITGISFRVPISNVSVVDLTVRIEKCALYSDICNSIIQSSKNEMKNIIGYTKDEVVSSDFNNNKLTCIFDINASIKLNNNFFKLIAWYDNETAYSNKLLDLIEYCYNKVIL